MSHCNSDDELMTKLVSELMVTIGTEIEAGGVCASCTLSNLILNLCLTMVEGEDMSIQTQIRFLSFITNAVLNHTIKSETPPNNAMIH